MKSEVAIALMMPADTKTTRATASVKVMAEEWRFWRLAGKGAQYE
jgi:hypothetical protein